MRLVEVSLSLIMFFFAACGEEKEFMTPKPGEIVIDVNIEEYSLNGNVLGKTVADISNNDNLLIKSIDNEIKKIRQSKLNEAIPHPCRPSPACRSRFTGPPYVTAYLFAGFVLPVSLARVHQTLKPLQAAFIAILVDAIIPAECPRFSFVPVLASIQCFFLPLQVLCVPAQSRLLTDHPIVFDASSRGRRYTSSPGSTVHTVAPGSPPAGLRGVPGWLV